MLLQPGHVLVAVNGLVVPGPCQELPQAVLETFKTSQRLCMLVVRRGSRKPVAVAPALTPVNKKPRNITANTKQQQQQQPFVLYRNPLFCDPKDPSLGLAFADDLEFEMDDGQRAKLFLKPVDNVTTWIQERKQKWRTMYRVYAYDNQNGGDVSSDYEADTK